MNPSLGSGAARPSPRRPRAALGARLNALAARRDPRRLERDPLGIVRAARDREAAALLAALLAFGNALAARRAAARAVAAFEEGDRLPASFRHRWIAAGDLNRLFESIRKVRAAGGGLEAAFLSGDDGDLRPALERFLGALRGPRPGRGLRFLLPSPAAGSACKRPLLFLRWVVRPDDGTDLGIWRRVAPSRLLVPLDTHVHRIAYWLGLTSRKTPSWAAAEEVTAGLRAFDAEDPVRFDFALAHLGILKECPRKPVAALCDRCSLRPHCRAHAVC